MAPEVSVVITCYNYGQYVAGCLESVFAQTYTDYEIILVDDGSTDNSEEQIKPFLQNSRLKYIRQKNSGQAKAKNRGIQESRGKFIAFLDADDKWDATKLSKQIPLFLDEHVGVVFSRALYIDENDQLLDFILTEKYLQPKIGRVTHNLYMNNFVPFSSSVVRKKCFAEFGGFDEMLPMGIDWDLWLRLSTGCSYAYVNEPLLFYRVGHPGQMSKNETTRHRCSDRIMTKFVQQYPDAVDKRTQKKAMLYTLCNRAEYYSVRKPWQGMLLSCKAVIMAPWYAESYRGFLLACRHLLFRVHSHFVTNKNDS